MKHNRFTTFSKIFTILIIMGAMLSLAACSRNESIEVEFVTVSTLDDISTITVFNGTLQMLADVEPEAATDLGVIWCVQNGTGSATISENGMLKAVSNGTVTVRATSLANPLISGTKIITLSNQEIVVEYLAISSDEDQTTIETFGGTLQMSAYVLPANAADKSVVWSVENGTGAATIDANGLLTAVENGTVTVKGTSASNSLLFDEMEVTLSHQEVVADSVTISSALDQLTIETFRGTLQMTAVIHPANTVDKAVVWSVENVTGEATITENGLLSALANGTVTVKVASANNELIFDTMVITMSHQEILISSISVAGHLNATTISTFRGTLQMEANILPANAADKTIIWSVENETGEATISESGLLSALNDGTVIVKATSSNQPLIQGTRTITLSNQDVLGASVEISSAGDSLVIDTFRGTLQFSTNVAPENTDNKSVVWSVENVTGVATISESGLLSALDDGTVTVKASLVTNALIFDTMEITLSNQDVLGESVEISSAGDSLVIDTFRGTLQFSSVVLPENTDNKSVVWSVTNVTGEASISEAGLLSALNDGTVTVKVSLVTNALIFDTMEITLSNQDVLGAEIDLLSAGDVSFIDTFRGTLQFSANVAPENTDNKSVVWSVENVTGEATISESGLLSALDNGTVTVKVTLVTNALIFDTMEITLSNQDVLGESVEISSAGDSLVIDTFRGTLQFSSLVLPENTDNKSVVWSVTNVTGEASISEAGLLSALNDGTVTVKASLVTNALIFDTMEITLSNQDVLAESIEVKSAGDVEVINTFGGTLQFSVIVLPADTDDKSVIWSVENGTGEASISESGLLSALENGTVTVKATSTTDALIFDTMLITISNQEVLITSITVVGFENADTISTFGGTLQMEANILPIDADNQLITWSVVNGTGQATISQAGILSAVENGMVTVLATSVNQPLIYGSLEVTISNQEVLAESILVSSEGDVIIIDTLGGTLQMYAEVLPVDADDQLYTWTVENVSGQATINELGLLTAFADGTVLVIATLTSDPLIFDSLEITISNQEVVVITGGVDLLSAGDFAILSKTGISTTVGTHITGNLGVSPSPASYITGFDLINDASNEFATSALVTGMIYAADLTPPTPTYLSTAVSDMEAAYTDAAGRAPNFTELHEGDVSGQTLAPGVYYWSSGLLITTDVILSGNATDIWIFQVAGTLTQSAAASVILQGGALPSNVVWQVAAAVSIGVSAHFEGTILSMTSVTLGTSATYVGKIFAQTAVILDANDIN